MPGSLCSSLSAQERTFPEDAGGSGFGSWRRMKTVEIGVVTHGKGYTKGFQGGFEAQLVSCFSMLIYLRLPPGSVVNYLCRLTLPS